MGAPQPPVEYLRDWETSLFGLCSSYGAGPHGGCTLCLTGIVFAPCLHAYAKSRRDGSNLVWNSLIAVGDLFLCFCRTSYWRWQIREQYGIQGGDCEDYMTSVLCYQCSSCQNFREVGRQYEAEEEEEGKTQKEREKDENEAQERGLPPPHDPQSSEPNLPPLQLEAPAAVEMNRKQVREPRRVMLAASGGEIDAHLRHVPPAADYVPVQCPSCGRSFAPTTAVRHIEVCRASRVRAASPFEKRVLGVPKRGSRTAVPEGPSEQDQDQDQGYDTRFPLRE